jgi:hypothetical protein
LSPCIRWRREKVSQKKKKKRGKKKNFGLSLFNNKKKVNLDVNEFILPKEVLLMWF